MVEGLSGKKQKYTYTDKNRVGDHICYYSDLRKMKQHYPGWKITRSLPQLVEEIFEIVRDLNTKEHVSFLLAEQNTMVALRFANYGYILENGRVVMDGEAKALRENEDVKEFYLGIGGEGRRSFRDVKHYRRRKRWL